MSKVDKVGSLHPPSKKCPKCMARKPTSEFYRNARAPDGLYMYCKTCKNKMNRAALDNVDTRVVQRPIASSFDYNCNICGMGYENQIEADDCCRPKRDAAPSSGTSKPKYGLGGHIETYLC